jgi:hypothetical protein
MDPITMILTALAAGATAGALDEFKDEVRDKVKAACGKLRDLVSKRFRDTATANGEAVLAEYEEDPENSEDLLKKKLTAAKADEDEALVTAAQAVVDLLRQQGKSSKYNVPITGSQGVYVGDRGTQTNTFRS